MAEVIVVKNVSHEGPGILGKVLERHNIPYTVVDLDAGDVFPDLTQFKAIVVMGGPDSANDSTDKMKKELAAIQQARAANIPYFGVCLGLQTLVKAMGGSIEKSPLKEIAFRDPNNDFFEISIVKEDPLFVDVPSTMHIFHLHGECVALTAEMQLLAEGKHCKNQVVKVGENAYGFQGHLEVTEAMLREWLTIDPDLLGKDEAVLKDYRELASELRKNSAHIFTNFLKIANLV